MTDQGSSGTKGFLVSIAHAARANNWCLRFPCTTCATQDARGEITRWVLSDPASFADELSSLGLAAFEADPTLGACVTIALGQLQTLEQPRFDRFTKVFIEHIPAGGSVVERMIGDQINVENLRSKLRGYRKQTAGTLRSAILEAWLKQCTPGDIRTVDRVIFYYVRPLADDRVRNLWFARGAALAVQTGDPSLHETLVWSLGTNAEAFPELVASLRQLRHNTLVARALRETGAEGIL